MTSLKQSVSLCALAVALGVGASPAFAQQSDTTTSTTAPTSTSSSSVETLSEVVVTGTRTVRPNITAAAPIVTVTAEEITQEGAVSVSDIINRLPQVSPDNQQFALNSDGSQNIINLHSVGTNRTLALIDGERIATAEGVNINAIPVALIQRIDVLTGGTSGVYGADAVAGVVNFIVKKDFQGLTVSAGLGGYEHDNDGRNLGAQVAGQEGYAVPHGPTLDGASQTFNVAYGHNFLDNKLNIAAYADYANQERVGISQRDYSSCYLTQNGVANTVPVCQLATGNPRTIYGTFTPQTGPNAGTPFADAKNGSQTFVANPDSSYTGLTNVNRDILNPSTSLDAGVFLNYKITPHINYYFDYMASSATSLYYNQQRALYNSGDYGLAPANYLINCNNPLMSSSQQTTLCGSKAGTSAQVPTSIYYQFAGNSKTQYDNLDQRFATGFKGNFLDNAFKFDVNYVYSPFANEQRGSTIQNNNINFANVNYALNDCVGAPGGSGCAPLNVFQANQSPSNAAIAYIYGTQRGKSVNEGSLYDDTANLGADLGKFGVKSPFAKDGVAVNLGGEFRIDRENNDCQDPLGQIGCGNFTRSESVKEVYAEINTPLIQDSLYTHLLSLDGAYRASQYSISSTIFSTWDLQAVYSPIKDITFRSTYSRAAREPTVYEYGSGILSYVGGSSDPCAGLPKGTTNVPAGGTVATYSLQQCEAMGVTAAQYGNVPQCDNNSCLARNTVSHPNPETGYTYTYGVLLQPRFIPHLTISVDYFNITVENIISYSYDSTWEQGCAQYEISYYCSHVIRNPNGSLTSADQYKNGTTPTTGFVTYGTFNGYRYYNDGIDLQVQYTLPVEQIRGSLAFDLNGEYKTYHGGQDGPGVGQSVHQTAGYFGTYAGIPQPYWHHTFRTTYTTNDKFWSVSADWRFIGGTSVTNDTGNTALFAGPGQNPYLYTFNHISDYNYLDLSTTWRFKDRYSVTVVCNNIFDRNPPLFPDAYNQNQSIDNTIPQTYDPLGRYLRISFTASL